MAVNLFLNLDKVTEDALRYYAAHAGRSIEEEIRKRLIESAGRTWEPFSANDIVNDHSLHIMFDLCKPSVSAK